MKNTINASYIKEIEAPWVVEVIGERFDNALEIMGPMAIVYGGAVRDCLAGRSLEGDLDIAVDRANFSTVSESFLRDSRWVASSNYRETKMRRFMDDEVRPDEVRPKDGYDKTQPMPARISNSDTLAHSLAPMSRVSSFETIGGHKVQLITSKQMSGNSFNDAIYMARAVDIICCGVVMTADGKVFEVIPGAFEDCKNGVLRLNRSSDTIYVEALPIRVKKLVNRGWRNEIDVERAVKEIKVAQEKKMAKEQAALNRARSAMGAVPKMPQMPKGSATVKRIGSSESVIAITGRVVPKQWDDNFAIDIPFAEIAELCRGPALEAAVGNFERELIVAIASWGYPVKIRRLRVSPYLRVIARSKGECASLNRIINNVKAKLRDLSVPLPGKPKKSNESIHKKADAFLKADPGQRKTITGRRRTSPIPEFRWPSDERKMGQGDEKAREMADAVSAGAFKRELLEKAYGAGGIEIPNRDSREDVGVRTEKWHRVFAAPPSDSDPEAPPSESDPEEYEPLVSDMQEELKRMEKQIAQMKRMEATKKEGRHHE